MRGKFVGSVQMKAVINMIMLMFLVLRPAARWCFRGIEPEDWSSGVGLADWWCCGCFQWVSNWCLRCWSEHSSGGRPSLVAVAAGRPTSPPPFRRVPCLRLKILRNSPLPDWDKLKVNLLKLSKWVEWTWGRRLTFDWSIGWVGGVASAEVWPWVDWLILFDWCDTRRKPINVPSSHTLTHSHAKI